MKRPLLFLLIFGYLGITPVGAFWDVTSEDDAEAIDYLEEQGIVEGYSDDSYRPENPINRAELLKILVESRVSSLPDEDYCFTDVRTDWYAPYVCYAKAEGWVEGYSDGTFAPAKNINRAEAIAMLLKVYDSEVDLLPSGDALLYDDVSISAWYASYLYTARDLGVLVDRSNFYPSDEITRGDMASAVYRLLLVLEDEDTPDVGDNGEANPFAGKTLYVDPSSNALDELDGISLSSAERSALQQIAAQPTAKWMGDWSGDIEAAADEYVTEVEDSGALPVIVLYNIPGRDCGSYSAGGLSDEEEYLTWISDFAEGVGEREAVVILEPDALALDCLFEDSAPLLAQAVVLLKLKTGISVYLDSGHPNWTSEEEMAERLQDANVEEADGFALNVSNFYTTEENIDYGEEISALVGGKHFIIDTSRNGNGWQGEWCNPSGASLGENPTTVTGEELADAYLWVKPPGESDGNCNGGPNAGAWWLEYALDLVWNKDGLWRSLV